MVVYRRGVGGSLDEDYLAGEGLYGYNMTDDEVLFDDVYDVCEIIGR